MNAEERQQARRNIRSSLVEDEPWDEGEFARDGLARFVGGYAGFSDRLGV